MLSWTILWNWYWWAIKLWCWIQSKKRNYRWATQKIQFVLFKQHRNESRKERNFGIICQQTERPFSKPSDCFAASSNKTNFSPKIKSPKFSPWRENLRQIRKSDKPHAYIKLPKTIQSCPEQNNNRNQLLYSKEKWAKWTNFYQQKADSIRKSKPSPILWPQSEQRNLKQSKPAKGWQASPNHERWWWWEKERRCSIPWIGALPISSCAKIIKPTILLKIDWAIAMIFIYVCLFLIEFFYK